jgi:hypothetical protein
MLEIHFRLSDPDDQGRITIDSYVTDDLAGTVSQWSQLATASNLAKAALECGGEMALQYEREQRLQADVANDPLMRILNDQEVDR